MTEESKPASAAGTPKRVLTIINPVSGQQNPDRTARLLRKRAEELGCGLDVRFTEGDGDALRWAQAAADDGYDRIVVSGGDGTVMEAISGHIKGGSRVPVAQIPSGTASFVARSLDIPTRLETAVDVALTGPCVRLDVGYLPEHDRYFALVAGAGWDARLIKDAPRDLKRRIGFFAYILTGIKNLFTLRRTTVEITIDGKTQTRYAHTVMIANVGQIDSAGVALGPDIWPHDGKLDAVIVSSAGFWGMLGMFFRVLTRQYDGDANLIYAQASRVEIHTATPLPVEIDGEPFGETPLIAEAIPDAALVVVPEIYAEKLRRSRDRPTRTP